MTRRKRKASTRSKKPVMILIDGADSPDIIAVTSGGQRQVRNTRLGKWYANSPNAQRAVSLGLLGATYANPVVGGTRASYLAAKYGIPLIRNGARAYRRIRYAVVFNFHTTLRNSPFLQE